MKQVARHPKTLGERIAWLFTKNGLPALAAIIVGAFIGFVANGAAGLLLATIAGLLVMAAFKRLPIRLSPWQALVTDISPIIAKLCFMMIIMLPVANSLTLPSGHTPDTLTKYLSIVIVLPKNIISGPTTNIFPGFPFVVLASIALMVWGSMNLGKTKMWIIALLGLLLFTFSPTIASVLKGDPRLRLSLSSFGIGYYLAWFGLILIMVSKVLPRILKTTPAQSHGMSAMLNIVPPAAIFALLSQQNSIIDPGQHSLIFGGFDFEDLHHGIAAGFSASFAGVGAGAIVEEAGGYEGDFSGNEAPPPDDVPEPEPSAPEGPQASTNPDDPPGTTIQNNGDGSVTKRLPDGTWGTKYTDGTTYTEAPDHSSITVYPDGTTKEWSPETGLEVTHPNGNVEYTLPDGRTASINHNSDGSIDVKSADGGTLRIPKEGNPEGTLTGNDGTKYTFNKDGTGEVTTDMGKMTMDKDGNLSGTLSDKEGNRITMKPDGSLDAETADGDKVTVDAKGMNVKLKDGTFVNTDADGIPTSAHFKDKDGVTIDIHTDDKGTTHVKDDQGNSADINKDGSVQMKGANGSTATQDAEGNATITNGEGTTWTAKADGTGSVTDKKGNRIDLHKDGTLTVKEASGKSTTYTPDQINQMKAQAGGTDQSGSNPDSFGGSN